MKKKKKATKKERSEYEEPLQVEGSFMDIVKASVKHADKNSAKKKAAKK